MADGWLQVFLTMIMCMNSGGTIQWKCGKIGCQRWNCFPAFQRQNRRNWTVRCHFVHGFWNMYFVWFLKCTYCGSFLFVTVYGSIFCLWKYFFLCWTYRVQSFISWNHSMVYWGNAKICTIRNYSCGGFCRFLWSYRSTSSDRILCSPKWIRTGMLIHVICYVSAISLCCFV